MAKDVIGAGGLVIGGPACFVRFFGLGLCVGFIGGSLDLLGSNHRTHLDFIRIRFGLICGLVPLFRIQHAQVANGRPGHRLEIGTEPLVGLKFLSGLLDFLLDGFLLFLQVTLKPPGLALD